MINKIISGLVFVSIFCSVDAQAAKNECHRASSRVEKLICSDDEIVSLESQLKAAYESALQSGDSIAIKEEQLSWVKAERNICKDVSCLKSAYTKRLNDLGWAAEVSGKYSQQNPLISLMPSGETVQYSGDVKQKAVELTGSVEEFRDSVGGGYRLFTGDKRYTIRYVDAISEEQGEVLSKLANSHQKVTVKGVINIYKDGSAEYSDQTATYLY